MAKRPCSTPGCASLVDKKTPCPKHGGTKERRTQFDQERGSASSRGYDRAWKKLRLVILRRDPVCRMSKDGDEHLSVEVDHIVPIAAGGERLDPANLQGLCKSCHSRKTATEDSSFAPRNALRNE